MKPLLPLVLILCAAPAFAQDAIPPTVLRTLPVPPTGLKIVPPPKPTDIPELVIAGRVVMRLRAQAGGLTPAERADALARRLGPILALTDIAPADVSVRQRRPGQTAYIYVRERLLLTVDRNTAAANRSSVDDLAQAWARNLRETLPQINVAIRMTPE